MENRKTFPDGKLLNRLSGTIWRTPNTISSGSKPRYWSQCAMGWDCWPKLRTFTSTTNSSDLTMSGFHPLFLIRGRAQIAVFKTERREIATKYYEYYVRPAETGRSNEGPMERDGRIHFHYTLASCFWGGRQALAKRSCRAASRLSC
jgi:hypothetical protein